MFTWKEGQLPLVRIRAKLHVTLNVVLFLPERAASIEVEGIFLMLSEY